MGNKLGFYGTAHDPAKLSDISNSHVSAVFQLRDEVYFAHKPKSQHPPQPVEPGQKAPPRERPRDPRRPSTAPGFNFEMKPRPAYEGPHPQAVYKPGTEPRELRETVPHDEEVPRDDSKFDIPTSNTGVMDVKARTYARCGRSDGRLYFMTVPPPRPRPAPAPPPVGPRSAHARPAGPQIRAPRAARGEGGDAAAGGAGEPEAGPGHAEAEAGVLHAIDGLLADIEAATGEMGTCSPAPRLRARPPAGGAAGAAGERPLPDAPTSDSASTSDTRPASAADRTRRRIGLVSERVRQTLKLAKKLESRRISSGEFSRPASARSGASGPASGSLGPPPPEEAALGEPSEGGPGAGPGADAESYYGAEPDSARQGSSKASLANVTVRLRASAGLSLPPIDESAEAESRRRHSRSSAGEHPPPVAESPGEAAHPARGSSALRRATAEAAADEAVAEAAANSEQPQAAAAAAAEDEPPAAADPPAAAGQQPSGEAEAGAGADHENGEEGGADPAPKAEAV
eukprot:tig00000367_g24464.t1